LFAFFIVVIFTEFLLIFVNKRQSSK